MANPFTFFDPKQELPKKLKAGRNTMAKLPSGAGYDGAKFAQDIHSLFDGSARNKTEDVQDRWVDHVLYDGNQYGQQFVSVDRARSTAEIMSTFFDNMQKGGVKDALMTYLGGDTKEAAQTLLDWCEYHAQRAQNPEQFANMLVNGMEQIEKNPEMKQQVFKKGGHGVAPPGELLTKKLRIMELLPKVRRNYEFAAVKSYKYEDSFFPEDDIDIRNMESVGEIMRVPKALLGCEDDEFYLKVATRGFPVMQHKRAIPMPKKFVILIDISGSMKEQLRDGYMRSEYAQATALALAEQAEAGGNQCEVIYFDGAARHGLKGTPQEIQQKILAEQFQGGGTNFEAAFRAADKTNADSVVIVTDGQSNFENPPKAPLMTLICGTGEGEGGNRELKQASYRYITVA